jgi:hypothetical protein
MRTTPHPVATAGLGLFAAQLKVLILTLILLSIGWLLACTQVRNTPNPTLGHLRSSWFNSLPSSEGASPSAGQRSAGPLVADQPTLPAQS